jgi:hypothetical protein
LPLHVAGVDGVADGASYLRSKGDDCADR